jgi:glucan phosphoethanolaminetransferase (alkaline phosphatase superfamily)
MSQEANSHLRQKPKASASRPETWKDNGWTGFLVVSLAFLPLTLPNLWVGKWRHSLFQLVLWLAIVGYRRWSVLAMIPFYLATPVLVYVCQHFGPPNLNLLASVRGSYLASEKIAFLGIVPVCYYWLYALLLVPTLAYLVLRRVPEPRTTARVRCACLLIAVGFMFVWGLQAHRSKWHGQTLFGQIVLFHIGSYQPLGLLVSSALAELDVDGQNEAALRRAASNYGASTRDKLDNIVFVIGESARADHWHINGYPRPTTPEIEQPQNLISFSNVLSLAPNTGLSWPFIFTPKPVGDSAHWPTQKSFISAFKEAGYHTYFVSFFLDPKFSGNNPMAIIGLEADTVVNGSPDSGKKTTDDAMLPAIRQILADKSPKLLVVSTQGSHTGFEVRVPLRYDVFQPSVLTGTRTPEGWRNGYDDTIRMTDDFLASVIAGLQGSRSVLFYVSDHGLACYDKGENLLGQSYIKPEYRPACAAWASKEFLDDAGRRARFDLGRQRAGALVTTDYLLHSFLDLCGIDTGKLVPAKSLFNAGFAPPTEWRVVDFQGQWHNFADVPEFPN